MAIYDDLVTLARRTFGSFLASGISLNSPVGINTTTITSGASLDVAGDIVVSDGAGTAKSSLADNQFQSFDSVATSHNYVKYSGNIGAAAVYTMATEYPADKFQAGLFRIFGYARLVTSTNVEMFEITAGKTPTRTGVVNFTSLGATRNTTFLSAGDFTVSDSGSDVVLQYTNNEGQNVQMVLSILSLARG